MSNKEPTTDCLECMSKGIWSSYADYKYRQGVVDGYKEGKADERAKVLEEVEKLYRDWLYSEYGKKAGTDNLTIRVISHFKEQK